MQSPYTHILLDHDSGEVIGAVREIDETDGGHFGLVRRFDSDEPEYAWIDELFLLRMDEAAQHVRNHVEWALKNPQPV
jgi:hypothetical protein